MSSVLCLQSCVFGLVSSLLPPLSCLVFFSSVFSPLCLAWGGVWGVCRCVCVGVCRCVCRCLLWCVTLKTSVCAFNTSPCVRSKRPRVYRQHAHMFFSCGHVAGTHGDVLNAHTEAFLNAHTEGLSLSSLFPPFSLSLSLSLSSPFSLFLSSSLSLFSFIFPCLVDDSSNHSLYLIELFNFSYPE